jgi:hypothetical protein
MSIYYLYIKTHKITGLNYLGQTYKNPYNYKGSGKYWKLHLKKHGNDVHTNIIMKCYTKSALKEWGLYYSKLWSVVQSKKWANLMPEIGDGSDAEYMRMKRADPNSGYHQENFKKAMHYHAKKRMEDTQYKENISTKVSKSIKNLWKTTEYQEKNCEKYIVTNPEGESFEIMNLNEFCRNKELGLGNMWSVSVGKRNHHKGWKCKKIVVLVQQIENSP